MTVRWMIPNSSSGAGVAGDAMLRGRGIWGGGSEWECGRLGSPRLRSRGEEAGRSWGGLWAGPWAEE